MGQFQPPQTIVCTPNENPRAWFMPFRIRPKRNAAPFG